VRRWLFLRLVWRALRHEPGRAALALLSVALGVSVFLAIRLANRSAVASFEGFARGLGTGADLMVQADIGPLDETGLYRLAPLRRDVWLRPILEGTFTRQGSLETFQVLATDLVGLAAGGGGQTLEGSFLLEPDAVLVSAALARAEGLKPGDPLAGLVDGRTVTLKVAGLLPEAANRPALQRNLLVMDSWTGWTWAGCQGTRARPWNARSPLSCPRAGRPRRRSSAPAAPGP